MKFPLRFRAGCLDHTNTTVRLFHTHGHLIVTNRMGAGHSSPPPPGTSCLFCTIASGGSAANTLWYEDELCAVFVPRTPAASLHFLVVPRTHVGTVRSLDAGHVPLLDRMRDIGAATLAAHDDAVATGALKLTGRMRPPPRDAEAGATAHTRAALPPACKLLFHVPPFSSVEHLHLHALRPPYAGAFDRLSFWAGTPWCATWAAVRDAAAATPAAPRAPPH